MDLVLLANLSAATVAAFTAAVVLRRHGRRPPALLLVAGLGMLALEGVLAGLSAAALLPEHMMMWQRARLVLAAAGLAPWLAFSLVYARTNYREFVVLWRWALLAGALLPLAAIAGWSQLVPSVVPQPGRWYWLLEAGPAARALQAMQIVGAALVLMNLERTLREAHGTMRWRVKFMLAGVLAMLAVRILLGGQALLHRAISPAQEPLYALGLIAGCALVLLSLRRTQQIQVDLYVSTRVVFGSVAALLVGCYLVAVALLAEVERRGAAETATLAASVLALLGLVVLLLVFLSDRLRVAARRFLSRHLRRPQYDYRELWRVLTERTLGARHAEELARAVTALASETFEALSVNLWLLDEEGRLRLGASTAMGGDAVAAATAHGVTPGLLALLQRVEAPLDLERARGADAELLRAWNPAQFRDGGHRLCMPLRAGHEIAGFMTVGDRVRGLSFTAEEVELFHALADQAAARLLSLRMAGRLAAAKEREALQLMSSFLVHDLKNTASSLSLTLQNLPVYFADPAFRRDAEATLRAGVENMHAIIQRLGTLRRNLEVQLAATDLDAWAGAVVQRLAAAAPGRVRWRPGADCRVRLDSDQMDSVVTNLVINAEEASPPEATVEIRSERRDGWAVLAVCDAGRGMTAEFVAQRLFRPFATTKKNGMGIGLYQSRLIVEAHGGRIEVDSQPGRGTVFRVLLPLQEAPHETAVAAGG